jgi:hypothetical protein
MVQISTIGFFSNQGHEWNEDDKGEAGGFDTSQVIWNFLKQFDMNGAKS